LLFATKQSPHSLRLLTALVRGASVGRMNTALATLAPARKCRCDDIRSTKMKTKLSLSTIAGILFTVGLAAASVAPNAFNIPIPVRPWLFMFAIAWTFLAVSGVFS